MACRLRLSILPAAWLVLAVNVLAAGQNATADAVVGWVAGPSGRGTLNLVWSCVVTIFACTWTVLHLNVPGLHEGPWQRALRKAKWMAINVLFPEFILSKAVCDLRQALNDLREFDENLSKEGPIKWTMFSDANDGHEWCWKVGPSHGPGDHPLSHLVLSEQDIQDRSKADWLVKSVALLQITWLVLNIAVRGSTGLPVTQLEIATLAFAIMAIITYLANWWKPKDVSQPTILQAFCWGFELVNSDDTQPFTRRLWSPIRAANDARYIFWLARVPNDVVWMRGTTPLVFVLMALSSLVFGGLHCLAWNFEFPTLAERICWRAASLVSAILPVATLGTSAFLHYLSTTARECRIISAFLTKLRPLEQLPPEWWVHMEDPVFGHWSHDAQAALVSMPRSQRDWEKEPSREAVEAAKTRENWRVAEIITWELHQWSTELRRFRDYWRIAIEGGSIRSATFRSRLLFHGQEMCTQVDIDSRMQTRQFIRDYEAFLRLKLSVPATVLPGTTCVDRIAQAFDETTKAYYFSRSDLQQACDIASTVLTICSGILYTASRLVILVLLFTSLRRVPAGVYQDTPWTRFLPTFS
ncbi:63aeee19-6ec6-4c30-a660-662427c28541 [Thermothielavioides terrestris]|uniref:63aeee19-6ec6-4c30-a660-662427c28541 n=1 Tax=Thermothielavioides terrestris TaxID=2587410 RepID=A0A3S5CXS6_9PEZI|nr:63aeee19-6ec6-4c30-a660-662427c28541 [Thermothielavioides terrestris]